MLTFLHNKHSLYIKKLTFSTNLVSFSLPMLVIPTLSAFDHTSSKIKTSNEQKGFHFFEVKIHFNWLEICIYIYLFNHLSCFTIQIRKLRVFRLHLFSVYFRIRCYQPIPPFHTVHLNFLIC